MDKENTPIKNFEVKAESYNKLQSSTGVKTLPKSYKTIVRYLERVGIAQTPKEIASAMGLNRNSVRVYLRRLDRRGFIHRPRRGYYQANSNIVTFSTLGMGGVGGVVAPRIHNMCLRGRYVRGSSKKVSFNGVVTVIIRCFKNGTCTVYVNCHGGSLDYVGWRILEAWIMGEVEFEGEPRVVSYELNQDFKSVRLDGCQALTLRAFDGSLERIYNKGDDLRSEVKPARGVDPLAVHALLKGGMTPYFLTQTSFMLVQEVRNLIEAVKYGNLQNLQIKQLFGEYLKRLWSEKE